MGSVYLVFQMVRLCVLVAVDEKQGYGREGHTPWNLPHEFQFFLDLIKDKAAIFGKNCWQNDMKSVPNALGNAFTAVVSTTLENGEFEKHSISSDLNKAIEICENRGYEDLVVVGGAGLFKAAMEDKRCDRAYVTRVSGDYGCDVFFQNDLMLELGFKLFENPDKNDEKVFLEYAKTNPNKHEGITYVFELYTR